MMSSLRSIVVAPVVISIALLAHPVFADSSTSAPDLQFQQAAPNPSVDYDAIKVAYHLHVAHLEALKAKIYLCLSSIEWNQDLWDLIASEEMPHRAFAKAIDRFGESFESAFADHDDLVRRDRNGRLRLTRNAMSAWTYIQAEQVFS